MRWNKSLQQTSVLIWSGDPSSHFAKSSADSGRFERKKSGKQYNESSDSLQLVVFEKGFRWIRWVGKKSPRPLSQNFALAVLTILSPNFKKIRGSLKKNRNHGKWSSAFALVGGKSSSKWVAVGAMRQKKITINVAKITVQTWSEDLSSLSTKM